MQGAALPFLLLLLSLFSFGSCGNDAPPTGQAVKNRDSLPVMVTYGVSKLISDSGVVRYKLISEEWRVFDKTKPQRQEFPKGIFMQRFDNDFNVDLYIMADTAYCYDQNLWELRGRVFVNNFSKGTTFSTEKLFWDMEKHELFSDTYMRVVTPDRNLEGNWFRSNEQMTKYHIKQTKGFIPMPRDKSADAQPSSPAGAVSAAASTDSFVRPREMPTRRVTPVENPEKES